MYLEMTLIIGKIIEYFVSILNAWGKKTKHKWNREKWQHKMCHPTYTIKPINCRPRKKEHPINYKFYRIAKNK